MSISKQQAEALAEGFLDNIGSSKDDFRPKHSISEVILLAGELIDEAQENLNRSNRNASGKLSQSLVADEPTLNGSSMRVDVLMNYYGAFVNKGVKGLKSGTSAAGYSFRYPGVSQTFAAALLKWITRAKASTRSVKKYKGYGSHEHKTKKISELDKVYAVGRSIKQLGLKPTGFLDKAVLSTKNKVSSRLGAALRIDVIDGLK
jgi:hypothetical protein